MDCVALWRGGMSKYLNQLAKIPSSAGRLRELGDGKSNLVYAERGRQNQNPRLLWCLRVVALIASAPHLFKANALYRGVFVVICSKPHAFSQSNKLDSASEYCYSRYDSYAFCCRPSSSRLQQSQLSAFGYPRSWKTGKLAGACQRRCL